jgi:nitroimidazol reductase NimA-like FMN-containing flavoprotein (pyridoxamine 5'-phosphate oxidase superfamily)
MRIEPHPESSAQVLSREECLSLMASMPVGRLVFTDRALPAVVPVNFVLSGGHIVLRTGATSSLAAAVRGSVVAFEVDRIDPEGYRGWSVTVVGRAEHVTDPQRIAQLEQLPLLSWAGHELEQFVVISVELVNGRRVGLGPVAARSQAV